MCIRDRSIAGWWKGAVSTMRFSIFRIRRGSLPCLLYTSDAADDLLCVDLGGRRFFQAEDGIRDFCLSRGLGDVYKRQIYSRMVEGRRFDYAIFDIQDPSRIFA